MTHTNRNRIADLLVSLNLYDPECGSEHEQAAELIETYLLNSGEAAAIKLEAGDDADALVGCLMLDIEADMYREAEENDRDEREDDEAYVGFV